MLQQKAVKQQTDDAVCIYQKKKAVRSACKMLK